MSDTRWQPIETAPMNGQVFLAYWGDQLVFAAWSGPRGSVRTEGVLWWKKRVSEADPSGFRVVMWFERGGYYAIDGNCAPFTPTHWMPLPEPPEVSADV
jgi:hypothetical protein